MDLNTLHALSRTCRQFHVNLTPFRHQLVRETLRCENEYIETVAEMLSEGAAIPNSVKSVLRLLSQGRAESSDRITRGKVGRCARDMVGECRRCSKIVCRVRLPIARFVWTRANYRLVELHDQSTFADGAEKPDPPFMSNLRYCTALLPPVEHAS